MKTLMVRSSLVKEYELIAEAHSLVYEVEINAGRITDFIGKQILKHKDALKDLLKKVGKAIGAKKDKILEAIKNLIIKIKNLRKGKEEKPTDPIDEMVDDIDQSDFEEDTFGEFVNNFINRGNKTTIHVKEEEEELEIDFVPPLGEKYNTIKMSDGSIWKSFLYTDYKKTDDYKKYGKKHGDKFMMISILYDEGKPIIRVFSKEDSIAKIIPNNEELKRLSIVGDLDRLEYLLKILDRLDIEVDAEVLDTYGLSFKNNKLHYFEDFEDLEE